jgi:hypothetical protein
VDSWTEEEARAYLPRLRILVEVLRRAAEVTARARGNGHSKPVADAVGRESPGDPGTGRNAGKSTFGDRSPDQVTDIGPTEALDELSERGIILRDPSRGLVDFPSRRPSGLVVLLCWQSGEEDLSWWHLPEDGFAGRRPLPVPPEI